MNRPRYLSTEKSSFSISAALVLTLSLIFLQEGFTYYVSFQMLALATIAILIFSTTRAIKNETHFFVAFLIFTFFVAFTAFVSPAVISRNSSNIFITLIGVFGYAAMIGCLPHLMIRRADLILHIFKTVSSATILVLAGLIALSESNLVPSLTRDAMIQQNTRLIDNFTDADALSTDQAFRLLIDQAGTIDLFYGEPSILAIVLFTCLGCFMLASKLLAYASNGSENTDIKSSFKSYESIILIGIIVLLYMRSFSSIIYALVVIYFVFVKSKIRREKLLTSISLLIIIAFVFLTFSYEYFLFRLTQTESLSFIQRFGFIFNIGINELLLGIKDESMLSDVGIHNGLFYIIAISGFGGVLYIVSLLYSVYTLSKPIKLFSFLALLLLAIMMQNGGVFSPSKVVLFSFILLNLACARTVYSGQHLTSSHGRLYG